MTQSVSQTPDDHLLFWRMVEALDIPLAEAIRGDELTPGGVSSMLSKCAHCRAPHYCALYLASRDGKVARPPSFCRNRARLDGLRALHPAD
ncbi:DUF6455 family protein [Pararhodobacter sp.]|uniref:DUF6455 family protein n=1 Tax=Pararhodobacter sp. TaxID=2127056 RepID=UPI002FE1D181|nr:DUF6455 family protein [Pseudomonadota bacterium]